MSKIETFPFDKDHFNDIRAYHFGHNWPTVYVIEGGREAYVGQSTDVFHRSQQHYKNSERKKLTNVHLISDEEFNLSASYDIEALLIQYMAADGRFTLQNGNGGLKNHNYYDRVKYQTKFEKLWEHLREYNLAQHTLDYIKNTDLFKYSPYKSLTEDQLMVAESIVDNLAANKAATFLIHGKPGTGKTVLATYLCKYLQEREETKGLKVGLVVPMTSLRGTIANVFKSIKGLKAKMVVGPNDVAKNTYDLLIVDESHRLQRRKGIMGYGAYDKVNKKLGLHKDATQLDWVMASSKYQILMYDEFQSVKPADIRKEDFRKLKKKEYVLTSQMRIGAGEEFVDFIEDIFSGRKPKTMEFDSYDFRLFYDIREMIATVKEKNEQEGLARLVAGYAWPWHTKPGASKTQDYDIEIDGTKLIWNSTMRDWVNSKNAVNEVGCIHTIQGYDLNYVGVIIGPEFGYDTEREEFFINRDCYCDKNGRNGITDPLELELYIKNIYKTLLTRGIKGTYVYIVDEGLRAYFQKLLESKLENSEKFQDTRVAPVTSPFMEELVSLPLYNSIGCGEATYADPNAVEQIEVPASLVRPGAKYFVLRTSGNSMNELGIEDGDLILCQKNYQASSGSIAVVLIGEDATLKEITYVDDGLLLTPHSTNSRHEQHKLGVEDEPFKVLGTFVQKLDL